MAAGLVVGLAGELNEELFAHGAAVPQTMDQAISTLITLDH